MSTELEIKYLKAYKKLGATLIEKGQWFLKKAFKVKVVNRITKIDIINLLVSKGFFVNKMRFTDFWYDVIDLEVMKEIIEYSWVDRKEYVSETFDCLLPNTPLLVKVDGKVQIIAVQELPSSPENTFVLDKDLTTGKSQWTKVNWVKEKDSSKDIITVKKREGLVQTTEDHKFYLRKKWTGIGEVERIGWEKMSFTHNNDWSMFNNNEPIDEDLAYAYGAFMADGTCRCYQTKTTNYGWAWHIDMFQKEALERCKKGLKKIGIETEIKLYDSQKKGSVRGGVTARRNMYRLKRAGRYGTGKRLVELFDPILYNENREKVVPDIILNANIEAKKAFLEGFLIGDGTNPREGVWSACVKSPTALIGLQIIANKIKLETSISYDKRSDCPIITFYDYVTTKQHTITKRSFVRENRGKIKVYDINTSSGHFFAGNFLVHNCDDYALAFRAHLSEVYGINSIALAKHIKVTTSSGKEIWHRAVVFLAVNKGITDAYLLETQNDLLIKLKKNEDIQLGEWTYSLSEIEF